MNQYDSAAVVAVGVPHQHPPPRPSYVPQSQTQTTTVVGIVEEDTRNGWSCLGNLLWMTVGGGIFFFFLYIFAGVLFFVTIIGIPCGHQLFKIAKLALFPYGVHIKARYGGGCGGCLGFIAFLVWLPFGLAICLVHFVFGILCIITIVPCLFGFHRQHLKLSALALNPFGKHTDALEDVLVVQQYTTVTTPQQQTAYAALP